MDYQREYLDGDAVKANSGFRGKYLNVMLFGTINEHWSYSYRQRLNKAHADQSFFDATDWIHITYRLNKNWECDCRIHGDWHVLERLFEYPHCNA
ncbi:MAG: hypothetical protein J6Q43_03555 [Bacteroidaceae bacterium]|nr:hypothetical protein [Bacteroidaceae bacterium]